MKKYYKRTIEKKKSKISPRTLVSLVVLLILCIVRLAVIPYAETQMALPEPKTEFSGLLDFWDIASVTVKGSKYSFQQTICSEFAQKYSSFKINFTALSSLSPEETITLNSQKGHLPDVIRTKVGSFELDPVLAIKDEVFCLELSQNYEPYIARTCNADGRLIADLYSNASVILYNKEALASLKQNAESRYTKDGFLQLLSELRTRNVSEKYNIIDFPADNVSAFLPFALCEDGSFDTNYLKKISEYLPAEHAARTENECINDFYSGNTLIYCGDLTDVNYLLRKREQGKLFDWAFSLYPADGKEIVFIKEITSYAFLESDDDERNNILKEFAEYMLSDDALKYTENLGMINCTSSVFEYETYPHLKVFKDKNKIFYTCRDPDIKKLYSEISNMFK